MIVEQYSDDSLVFAKKTSLVQVKARIKSKWEIRTCCSMLRAGVVLTCF